MVEQGAEARVFNVKYLGKPAVLKERYKRRYRHPLLDEHILKERIRAEARGLLRSKIAGIYINTKHKSFLNLLFYLLKQCYRCSSPSSLHGRYGNWKTMCRMH